MLSREEVERNYQEALRVPFHERASWFRMMETAQALYAERDEWHETCEHLATHNRELAAEGRLLREAVDEVCRTTWLPLTTDELKQAGLEDIREHALSALLATPLIADEVERVKRLEAVAEAADDVYLVMPSTYVPNGEGAMKVWVVVRDMEDLRAALAAWREGEGGGAA